MSRHNLTAKQTGEEICITKVSLPTQSLTWLCFTVFIKKKKKREHHLYVTRFASGPLLLSLENCQNTSD